MVDNAASGLATSAASSQKISWRFGSQARERGLELQGLADRRDPQHAALLGGFDGVGAHAIQIDAGRDRVMREHGLQMRDAHLGGLLHHVVEPRVLQRREEIVEVGPGCLGTRLRQAFQRAAPLAGRGDPRPPFAVAAR